jgi:DNA (cytosine-5)-methyltransferase 1
MWPATLEVIRLVRPRFAFLENVPGLLAASHGYFGTILQGLAEVGYDARWCVLSAGDCGASHQRKRLWIVATNTSGLRRDTGRPEQPLSRVGTHGEDGQVANPAGVHGQPHSPKRKREVSTGNGNWWTAEPNVGRVADGVASRVDRLKAIGNGQVPICAATAWKILSGMA